MFENQQLKKRAEELTAKLTLDEKTGMVHGAQLFCTAAVERLNIPALKMSDGPMGVRQEFRPDAWKPLGYSNDYVTYLPCNSAIAAAWNRQLAGQAGSVLGCEARGRGKDVILGPGINIKRSPLCGRSFEYFSEDPYLTKELAVPFIQGVQSWDVAACVKHFAANNQETQRLWVDERISEKALRQIYLPAFEAAVKRGGVYTLMTAYNSVNGEHCYFNRHLLDDILDGEWHYEGTVISDWGGVHDTEKAAASRLDIEMSVTDDFDDYYMAEPLKRRIRAGMISERLLDRKVYHILLLMMRLNMIGTEEEHASPKRKAGTYNSPAHRQTALEIARESVVLLKNEKRKLPLDQKDIRKILIIGENADCMHASGGGSAEIRTLYEITPLMGICRLLGGNAQVCYVPGYHSDEKLLKAEKNETDMNWQETSLQDGGGKIKETDAELQKQLAVIRKKIREDAVKLASEYETVLFIGGLNHEQDCEGNDRENMKLPYEQDILILELLKANPNTIIVLTGGSPVEMGNWIGQAKAVVWSWYSGMEGGTALAEILFGEVCPSGKLPETFYKKHTDCSAHAMGEFAEKETVNYSEGIYVGYRYNDFFHVEPQFCFGHGLSYTEFEYSNADAVLSEDGLLIFCDVKNTGSREGKETVQVYLRLPDKPDEPQQLRGFKKVSLRQGEKKCVVIDAKF